MQMLTRMLLKLKSNNNWPPPKNFCLKAISLKQLFTLLAIKRRLLVRKSRIDSDFDFSGLFQCRLEKISVDLFYNDDKEDDKKIHWLIFVIMIVNLLLLFLTDAGESALIKKLPPGTTYAHIRKRSGATANVIGKNKILIYVKITFY